MRRFWTMEQQRITIFVRYLGITFDFIAIYIKGGFRRKLSSESCRFNTVFIYSRNLYPADSDHRLDVLPVGSRLLPVLAEHDTLCRYILY